MRATHLERCGASVLPDAAASCSCITVGTAACITKSVMGTAPELLDHRPQPLPPALSARDELERLANPALRVMTVHPSESYHHSLIPYPDHLDDLGVSRANELLR